MPKRNVFVSLHDKSGIEKIAGFGALGYGFVSLGETAKQMRIAGLTVVDSLDFLGLQNDKELKAMDADPSLKRQRREKLAFETARRMLRRTADQTEEPSIIDAAYISLMPVGRPEGLLGPKKDKSGAYMIDAACEANIPVFVDDRSIGPFMVRMMQHEAGLIAEFDMVIQTSRLHGRAQQYLAEYALQAQNVARAAAGLDLK
jgi:hypothetical protein